MRFLFIGYHDIISPVRPTGLGKRDVPLFSPNLARMSVRSCHESIIKQYALIMEAAENTEVLPTLLGYAEQQRGDFKMLNKANHCVSMAGICYITRSPVSVTITTLTLASFF